MRPGAALIVSMIFVLVFSALAVSLATVSGTNVQLANNQRTVNCALTAAQSGIDCAKYLAATCPNLPSTPNNTISPTDAANTWTGLCTYVHNKNMAGKTVSATPTPFTDAHGSGTQLVIPAINYGTVDSNFTIRFYRYNNDPNTIKLESTGTDNGISRKIIVNLDIQKDRSVLKYAIASRGRIWITGDSTVHGSIYSAWNLSTSQLTQISQLEAQIQQKMTAGTLNSTSFANLVTSLSLTSANRTTILNELIAGTLSPSKAAARCIGCMSTSSLSVAPFNMTSDSTVLGTINTCWTKDQVGPKSWQFETWDALNNPIYQTNGSGDIIYETDSSGNFLLDDNGEKIKARVVTSGDEIQGVCAGINYGEAPQNLAGLNIADYDTTTYYDKTRTANGGSGDIPCPSATQYNGNDASLESLPATCGTKWRYERFPHDAGNYTTGSGIQVKRYIYKNQTFTDARLLNDKNALFINCTFNDVLYVDCGKTTSNYNNVRFDNCTFNGTLVSNTPQSFNWQKNTLYFTGSATFQNTSADATILAPHFNVNLGNTNPVAGTDNVLHGAIVGGIVDVRGNAEVFGTIISMADTSSYTSGYVSNIGATLLDGGSETVSISDIGTINITPDPDKGIPSGITTPIVIKPSQGTYCEEI